MGPYPIEATVTDLSTVTDVRLYYRLNEGAWLWVAMAHQGGDVYAADLPGSPAGSRIDYYVQAEDGAGLISTDPPAAPLFFYSLFITSKEEEGIEKCVLSGFSLTYS